MISVNRVSVKTIFVKTISVRITFLKANRNTSKFWMHVMVIGKNGTIRYSTVWYGIVWYGMRSKEKWNVAMEKLKRDVRVSDQGEGEAVCVCTRVWVVRLWEEGRKKWGERLTNFTLKNNIACLMFWQSKWRHLYLYFHFPSSNNITLGNSSIIYNSDFCTNISYHFSHVFIFVFV